MNPVLLLCFVFAITYVDCTLTVEQLERLTEYSRACRAETGATISQVTRAIAGYFDDDPKLKAQLYCISRKVGFQNDVGDMVLDVIREKIASIITDPHMVDELIELCAIKQATPEETAYITLKCYLDKRGINFIH
ncbi:B2 protein [Aethina tumida]|uniref:B2 protein n=1 Tax=Aethina tumida TaxID=116153 RepID=UPI002147D477|nr:B2 protein [Aethina tumida]